MTAPELKPCPFCGGTNVDVFGPIGWYRQFGISHSCRTFFGGSGDFTIGAKTKEEAIAAWNTRAPDPDLDAAEARIAELEAALRILLDCPHIAERDAEPAWIEPETEAAVAFARAKLVETGQ